jgi:hypothetical protein
MGFNYVQSGNSERICDEAPPSEVSEQIIQQKEVYRVAHKE